MLEVLKSLSLNALYPVMKCTRASGLSESAIFWVRGSRASSSACAVDATSRLTRRKRRDIS